MAVPVAYDLESLLSRVLYGSKLFLRVETEMLRTVVYVGEGAILSYEDAFIRLAAKGIATTLDGGIMLRLGEYGLVCLRGDVDDVSALLPMVCNFAYSHILMILEVTDCLLVVYEFMDGRVVTTEFTVGVMASLHLTEVHRLGIEGEELIS